MGCSVRGKVRRHGRRNHVTHGLSYQDVMTPLTQKGNMGLRDGDKMTGEREDQDQSRAPFHLLAATMAPLLALLLNLWLAHGIAGGPISIHGRQTTRCTNTTFTSALPSGAYVERVDDFPSGNATYGEQNIYGNAIGMRLGFCAVTVRVVAPENSDYRFGLFLPAESNWTGNFLAVGNYAQLGGINWADMGAGVKYGMATISTDTGHLSSTSTLAWALERNQGALPDWGYRAVNGSIHIGKDLVRAYYATSNKSFEKSFWSGCSTGGRQGLKQIQISPDSLDGVLIGAPAWDTKHLFPWIAKVASYSAPVGSAGNLNYADLYFLYQYLYGYCDPQDGRRDGTVSWPEECTFNLTDIQCVGGATTNCLTAAKIETVRRIQTDYTLPAPNNTVVFPGPPQGTELTNPFLLDPTDLAAFPMQYFKYFLYPSQANDPRWNNFDYFLNNQISILNDSETINPGQATADNFNLKPFKDRGGKVIMYHGTRDSTVPTGSTAQFYSSVLNSTTGGNSASMDEFFKLFYVPGMGHCYSDAGTEPYVPWHIGGAGQQVLLDPFFSVPNHKFDPQNDALQALLEWVGKARIPSSITATAYNGTSIPYQESYSRPLCAFPKRSVYNASKGPDTLASSYDCV
ncbi:Tannase/feruloyl esterase [Naviculisporaceae sp. PSN 640]